MLRAIISISLIFIFLFSSGLYFFIFKTQEYLISKEVREELAKKNSSDADIVIIKDIPSNKILWLEEDEFMYNGELYDLLSKTESDGNLYLYCLHDEREGELIAFLKDFINSFADNGKAKTNNFSFLKDYQTDNVPEKIFNHDQTFVITKVNYFDFYQFLYNSISIRLASPPPEFSFQV